MNYLKIQQEVGKALLLQKHVSYYFYEGTTFLTTTGTVGWFVPDDKQLLKLTGAQAMASLGDYTEALRPEYQLIGTDTYRVGGSARMYTRRDGLTVYVDTALLKYFDHPTLYQMGGPLAPIAVAEDTFDTGEYDLTGIVCPKKVEPEEDDE